MTVLTDQWRKHCDSFFSWHFIFQPRSHTRASMTHPVNHEVWTDSPSSARWDISQGNWKTLICHRYNCRSQRTLSDPVGREHLYNIQTDGAQLETLRPPLHRRRNGAFVAVLNRKSHLEMWNKIVQPVIRSLFRLKKMTCGQDVLAVQLLAGCTLKTKSSTNQDQQRYKILDLWFPVWFYLQSGRKNENIWVNFISCCFLNMIDYKCVLVLGVGGFSCRCFYHATRLLWSSSFCTCCIINAAACSRSSRGLTLHPHKYIQACARVSEFFCFSISPHVSQSSEIELKGLESCSPWHKLGLDDCKPTTSQWLKFKSRCCSLERWWGKTEAARAMQMKWL